MGVSAFLIALNEEDEIERALDSIRWTDEQIVVDGGSTDRTVEICKHKGAKVFQRPFDHFECQKNYALSLTTQDWVLSVDADESVSPVLAAEIKGVATGNNSKAGYFIKRRNYFFGKPMRFGGQGDELILRLFRRDRGKFTGMVHEVVKVDGPIGTLNHILEHYGTKTLDDYMAKFKLYTDLEVSRLVAENRVLPLPKAVLLPLGKWMRDYIFRAGFLDGRSGFYYHALSCYYGWTKNLKAYSQKPK